MPMTTKRLIQIETDPTATLTQEELDEGYHFCPDWDGLLIHKDDPESACCTCNIIRKKD